MGRTRWSAIGLIATTYIYFLVFAQFGFLHRVRESLGEGHWNLVLGVMGIAGLAGALFTLACYRSAPGRRWLMAGFIGAGMGALLAAYGTQLYVFALSAGISGFFLSILTVSLVGVLADMLPTYRVGLVCGIGTGLAYFVSNVPLVFEASARGQSFFAALVCVGGLLCARGAPIPGASLRKPSGSVKWPWLALLGWVGVFMILIWSDSAAFTRIQETPAQGCKLVRCVAPLEPRYGSLLCGDLGRLFDAYGALEASRRQCFCWITAWLARPRAGSRRLTLSVDLCRSGLVLFDGFGRLCLAARW